MILATINKSKNLLHLNYIGHVKAGEIAESHGNVMELLAELNPGFRLLADLNWVDSIDMDCGPEIGRLMELFDAKGVSLVVRVIPDPTKDIGLSILSFFHYQNRPRTVTCKNMAEAAGPLGLT